MNIDQMRHMSEVVRYGSFSQAADALYISQPSLSASIKKFEQEIGEPIFNRHNTGVTLTPFGEELLPYVRNVLNLLDQMPLQVYGTTSKYRPRLSVCNGGYRFMAKALGKVYETYRSTGIHIDYYDVNKTETLSMVEAGTAQVGGYGIWSFQKQRVMRRMEDGDILFIPITIARPTVGVGPQNPLYNREEDWVTLDMIKEFPRLYSFSETTNALYKRLGIVSNKNILTCRNRMGRSELLENTDCISVSGVPLAAYRDSGYYNGRRVFYIKGVEYTCEVGYIRKKSVPLSRPAEDLVEHLTDLFA